MRIHTLFAWISTLLGLWGIAAAPAQPSSGKPPFSLSLEAPQSSVKLGSPVMVIAHWTNTSDHKLFFAVGGPGRATRLEVLNSGGKPVEETEYGRKAHGKDTQFSGSVATGILDPGKTSSPEIDLNQEYVLNKPGQYTVQAQRWDEETHTLVKSNTLTFTLTQ